MSISTAYQAIVASAVDGHYEHDFFGTVDTTKGFEDASNMHRLRAAVQHLNLQFASQMRQYGHKYRIQATKDTAVSNDDLPEPSLVEEYAEAKTLQSKLSRTDAVEWVKGLLVRTRGKILKAPLARLRLSIR